MPILQVEKYDEVGFWICFLFSCVFNFYALALVLFTIIITKVVIVSFDLMDLICQFIAIFLINAMDVFEFYCSLHWWNHFVLHICNDE